MSGFHPAANSGHGETFAPSARCGGPLPLKLRQVARRRVRILLQRFLVFPDHFEHRSCCPPKERADLQILVRRWEQTLMQPICPMIH